MPACVITPLLHTLGRAVGLTSGEFVLSSHKGLLRGYQTHLGDS